MTLQDQIRKAVGAHALWKGRLRNAIDSGKCEMSVDQVRANDRCEFGQWLKTLDASSKKHPAYKECSNLHQKFHIAAAHVLGLALAGKKKEATDGIGDNSEFGKLSIELTKAMMHWH